MTSKFKETITDSMNAEEVDDIMGSWLKELGYGAEHAGFLREALERITSPNNALGLESFINSQTTRTLSQALEAIRVAAATKFMSMFKYIFGDFMDASELWSDVVEKLYTTFIEPLNHVLDVIGDWASSENGGRQGLVTALYNILDGIQSFLDAVSESWHRIFSPVTAESIAKIVDSFMLWTESFKNKDWSTFQVFLEAFLSVMKFAGKSAATITKIVKPFVDIIFKIVSLTIPQLTQVMTKLTSIFEDGSPIYMVFEKTAVAMEAIVDYVWKFINNTFNNSRLFTAVDSWWATLRDKISGFGVWGEIEKWFNATFSKMSVSEFKENFMFKGFTKSFSTLIDFSWDIIHPILTLAENFWFFIIDLITKSVNKMSEFLSAAFADLRKMSLVEFLKYIIELKATVKRALKVIFWIWGQINLQRLVRGLAWMMEGWADIGDAIWKVGKGIAKKLKAEAMASEIKAIATLVGTIVGSFVALAILFSNPKYAAAILIGTAYAGVIFVALMSFIKKLSGYCESTSTAVVQFEKKSYFKNIFKGSKAGFGAGRQGLKEAGERMKGVAAIYMVSWALINFSLALGFFTLAARGLKKTISSLDDAGSIILGFTVIGGIIAGMWGLSKLIGSGNAISNLSNMYTLMNFMKGIGISLIVMSGSLAIVRRVLGDITNLADMAIDVSALGAIIIGFAGLVKLFEKWDIKAFDGVGLGIFMTGLAIGLSFMAKALNRVAEIGSIGPNLWIGIGAIAAMSAVIELLGAFAINNKLYSGMARLALVLVGIAIAARMFVNAFSKLTTCFERLDKLGNFGEKLGEGFKAMGLGLLILAGALTGIALFAKIFENDGIFGNGMRVMAYIGMITAAIWVLSKAFDNVFKAIERLENTKIIAGGINGISKDIKDFFNAIADGLLSISGKLATFLVDILNAPLLALPGLVVRFISDFIVELSKSSAAIAQELALFIRGLIVGLEPYVDTIQESLTEAIVGVTKMLATSGPLIQATIDLVSALIDILCLVIVDNRDKIQKAIEQVFSIVEVLIMGIFDNIFALFADLMAHIAAALDKKFYPDNGKTDDERLYEYQKMFGVPESMWVMNPKDVEQSILPKDIFKDARFTKGGLVVGSGDVVKDLNDLKDAIENGELRKYEIDNYLYNDYLNLSKTNPLLSDANKTNITVDSGAFQITVNAAEGMSSQEVADEVIDKIKKDILTKDATRGLTGNWFKY